MTATRVLSSALGAALAALAAAYLGMPAWWQWATASPVHADGQISTEAATGQPGLVARLRAVPACGQGAPVILTYHVIANADAATWVNTLRAACPPDPPGAGPFAPAHRRRWFLPAAPGH
jgi:hypothetical protein